MKTNGNNLKQGEYFLGLDVGTDSVGWAVTDCSENYNILRFKGNNMCGIRLFDEASDCQERSAKRRNRRRMKREKERLNYLEYFFAEEITKIDPDFFKRLNNSFLLPEDKENGLSDYSFLIFNDKNYNDKNYMKEYPTIYHLRNELVHSTEPHDVRLVFLAIHHILKKRGHFLFDTGSDTEVTIKSALDSLVIFLDENYNTDIDFDEKAESLLSDFKMTIRDKKKKLADCISSNTESEQIDIKYLTEALSGSSTDLGKLFKNDNYSNIKVKLSDDLDEKFDELSETIGDDIELISELKTVFDTSRLSSILGKNEYICESKVQLFNKNKADLKELKEYVKNNLPEKYKEIFSEKKDKLNNYSAYSRKDTKYTCSQEDFCKYLKSVLKNMEKDEAYSYMWKEISESTFLSRLSSKDNGLIPNQVHRKELKIILENASQYLGFLNDKDEYGTVSDKILSVFDFRIPFYVGPLNRKSDKSWVIRKDEKIYPWNIENVVDLDSSAEKFMENLIGRCGYTGDPVLPKDSLLYSEYMLLNELNPIKLNDMPVSVEVKNKIVKDLFMSSCKNVSKKAILKYLVREGLAQPDDVISGIDDMVKTKLKSYHDFERLLKKHNDREMVENIIKGILVYKEDKKLLKRWIRKNYSCIDENDIAYICRLKYKDWGRLSEKLLTGIYCSDENGEAFNIIDMLRSSNMNLMQLLSTNFDYSQKAEEYKKENYHSETSIKKMLDDMYISPGTRRSVFQTVKIIDEITDIMKGAPKKIFIEVAREKRPDAGRTETRKNILLKLYDECDEKETELYEKLLECDDSKLRDTTMYLYFLQLGKCMYSGEPIDLDHLTDTSYYDIDHIYPQSKVVDDSLDNKVLVKSKLNRDKSNNLLSKEIREKMTPFWNVLKSKNLLSEKKYSRLVRTTELSADELSAFVNRQLVETQQSTKAIAALLKELYHDAGTVIVYSKAGNVTRFRQQFNIVKSREVNDLHHAKDAYLNIVVGNVYDTKFTDKFFLNIKSENYSLNRVFDFDVSGAWKKDGSSIGSVKKNLGKNSIRYTRLLKEGTGSISDETILPAGGGQLPIKKNLDIEKYGGYNKVSGAFFCVVEHTKKKKRIRTIEPVFVYAKREYLSDPEKYCKEILMLDDPIIVEEKVPMESLIEIDGIRYNITGRTGDAIVGKHAFQFVVSEWAEMYIKEIAEYIEACKKLNKEIDAGLFKQGKNNIVICLDNNLKLFDMFVEKLCKPPYSQFLNSVKESVTNGREIFVNLSVNNQCIELLEILKAFKCDRQLSDLSYIKAAKQSGVIKFNKNISGCKTVYLMHQSSTGLYEYKTDLLRKL